MLFSSPIPRPEYPRPDRQRGLVEGIDWLNLNGPWQFRFDPHRRGVEEHWFAPGGPDWREQIIVPFCWESLAAWGEGNAAGNDHYFATRVYLDPLAVNRANHRSAARHEVGWYRRAVPVPNGPAYCWVRSAMRSPASMGRQTSALRARRSHSRAGTAASSSRISRRC